ncbi:uncharacterized protein LOC143342420 isoform X2 [Colletes latitarsis]|uniref:uncharacterized protein LOC143342420 isoform X1 n=2 Tax=Colletes latitarsis TaxID=2605962 RepID=UPI004036AE65
MIMEDRELITLQNLKANLVKKARDLNEKLKKQQVDDKRITLKISNPANNNFNNIEKNLFGQHKQSICEITRQVTGITFKDIKKKWLGENIYQYKTYLVTTSLKLFLDLTVKLEGGKEFEIYDITCHFLDVDKCYLLEVTQWVQNISRMKNFSLFMSALSQYNQEGILRTNILNESDVTKFASFEDCNNGNGGILVNIHSIKNVQQIYLYLQWLLVFVEHTWQIEHYFLIQPTEIGDAFTNENQNLLNDFQKVGLEKARVTDFWNKMYHAIDQYENKNLTDLNKE